MGTVAPTVPALARPSGPSSVKERRLLAAAVLIAIAMLVGTAAGISPLVVCLPVAIGAGFAAIQSWLLSWRTLIALIFLVILLVPMKRYALLPGSLPFKIELYRVVLVGVSLGWIGSLLVDRTTKLRRTGLEWPLLGFFCAVALSDVFNINRVGYLGVGGEVVKKLTFLMSFVLMVYLVSSVVTKRRDLERLIRVLVFGGTIVAVCALYESRTGVNMFDKLHSIFPPLKLVAPVTLNDGDNGGRGGRLRVFASAEHPIALSAALAMLMPLALYLYKRDDRKFWLGCAGILTVGVISAVSRTGVTMLLSILIVYSVNRPASVRRTLPLLLPMIVAMHIAVPGAIGGLKSAFFPPGGVVAEQQYGAGTRGSGRIADIGPGLSEWSAQPWFGQGYGTRISDLDDPRHNAGILDNQWLGTLLETGVAGFATLLWLFCRSIRRLTRMAKRDMSDHGWLLVGLAASLTAFCVGMFTFDAFNFSQVTFLAFIFLGLGVAALRPDAADEPAVEPAGEPAPEPSRHMYDPSALRHLPADVC